MKHAVRILSLILCTAIVVSMLAIVPAFADGGKMISAGQANIL